MLFIKCRQKHCAKLFSNKDVNHPCFQILRFRGVRSRFPPYTTVPCKICNFTRNVNVVPRTFYLFGFYRRQHKRLSLQHLPNSR